MSEKKEFIYFISYIEFEKDNEVINMKFGHAEVHYNKIIHSMNDLNAIIKNMKEYFKSSRIAGITILNYKLLRIEKNIP